MKEQLKDILEKALDEIFPNLEECSSVSFKNASSLDVNSKDVISKNLEILYDEISLFNPTYGLVNASEKELLTRHILDCLAPLPKMRSEILEFFSPNKANNIVFPNSQNSPKNDLMLPFSIKCADLGSGAGLPGLVIASVFPKWNIHLVERMGRRAGFLRNTIAKMGLSQNVEVIQKDLSEVQNSYNVITFRAFRHFEDIVYDLNKILEPNGIVFAYKSSDENIQEELECLEHALPGVFTSKTFSYQIPFCNAKRQILILKKLLKEVLQKPLKTL